jgi:hypothetical protein
MPDTSQWLIQPPRNSQPGFNIHCKAFLYFSSVLLPASNLAVMRAADFSHLSEEGLRHGLSVWAAIKAWEMK